METVSHHGRETAYRATGGSGPVTLFVHGSGGTHRVWAHQYGPDGCRPAAALDLSGHGESDDIDTSPGTPTVEAYVEDVAAVATATDADVLVGNSLGGAVIQQLLVTDAYDPERVVLAGTGAKLTVAQPLRDALRSDFGAAVDALDGPDRLFHDVDETIRSRSRQQLHAVGRRVTERDFLTCHRFDARDRLGAIGTPALALVGEHDTLTPISYHEYLAEKLPRGEVSVLSGAAHLAMIERPAAFTEAVREWRDAQ